MKTTRDSAMNDHTADSSARTPPTLDGTWCDFSACSVERKAGQAAVILFVCGVIGFLAAVLL